jgi:hypothetical protein
MKNPYIIQDGARVYLTDGQIKRLEKLEFIKRVHYHPARKNSEFSPFVLTVPFEQVEKILELR